MLYFLAKDFQKPGSIILEVDSGKDMIPYLNKMEEKTEGYEIQFVLLLGLESYKEYAPFKEVFSQQAFEKEVTKMMASSPSSKQHSIQ